MERFIAVIIVSGGLVVGGLWLATTARPDSVPRLLGIIASLLGGIGLAIGIWGPLDPNALFGEL